MRLDVYMQELSYEEIIQQPAYDTVQLLGKPMHGVAASVEISLNSLLGLLGCAYHKTHLEKDARMSLTGVVFFQDNIIIILWLLAILHIITISYYTMYMYITIVQLYNFILRDLVIRECVLY